MTTAQLLLVQLSPHQPNLVLLAMVLVAPITWRTTGPPERASALTISGVAVLDFLCWWLADGFMPAHALVDSLALSWMIPVALRANRLYPAVIAAALLIAAAAQWLLVLRLNDQPPAVSLIAGLAHLVALIAYLCGWHFHRRSSAKPGERPAWRDQMPPG
jgi:hypothetical protein